MVTATERAPAATSQPIVWAALREPGNGGWQTSLAANPTQAAPPTVSPTQARRTPEKIPGEKLDQYFSRAEKLVVNGSAGRAYALGSIMNRLGFPRRAIPLLKAASKERTTFALFESLLDAGDWKEAEAIFAEVSRQISLREMPSWHSRLALAAAADGHKADALRLWFRTANASPLAQHGLEQLARLGLRDDLIAFYRTLQNELPASRAPARALKSLEAK